ncbi:MAG: glycoside hydrolase family 15 protein [Candidatus Woesearchaeota archaeon]|nr:glycoside hydrolase family 15 protein [Candidatus Woesearchaeota archaeon]
MLDANRVMRSFQILNSLRHPNGLFSASRFDVKTGYDKAWIRDNIYQAIGVEAIDPILAIRTYHALLDILLKHEGKIDWAIKEKPKYKHQYIHARYDPRTMNEIWEEWGNKQNDAIGLLLFKIADLMDKGFAVIRDEHDLRIIQKLVYYLASIEYWHDKDNGIWEENEEIHASSVGACLAGLIRISSYVYVPQYLIEKGKESLNNLLPRESETKEVDMALLSLIYPFDIVTEEQKETILKNIETKLLRNRGLIRYPGDKYYYKNGEAEWVFGFPWLAIIYRNMGKLTKYRYYIQKTFDAMNERGELPELYFADSDEHNENSPLGWAQALFIVAAG